MEIKKGNIEGVIIIPLKKNEDKRGYLLETFRVDTLPENIRPVMGYISYTNAGVARGPHEHNFQTDIFSFIGPGEFQVKLWDNRINSKTYGYYMEIIAGKKNPITVIIPPHIVHAYKNISAVLGMVLNYPDKLYKGWNKKDEVDEIRYENRKNADFKIE